MASVIAVLSDSDSLCAKIIPRVESLGYSAERFETLSSALNLIHRSPIALAIVDLELCKIDKQQRAILSKIQRDLEAKGLKMLGLTRSRDDASIRTVFECGVTNFLAIDRDGECDLLEFTVTVQKMLNGGIFGLDQYLGEIEMDYAVRVRALMGRPKIADHIQQFATEVGCHPQIATAIATAMEELLTNAVEYAPSPPVRPKPTILANHESVRVRFASDGKRVGVSVTDPFGTLDLARTLEFFLRCFQRGPNQVVATDDLHRDPVRVPHPAMTNAGIGLYYVFHLVQSMVINVSPGRGTEAIIMMKISKSYRQFSVRPRSFNIFVERDARIERFGKEDRGLEN